LVLFAHGSGSSRFSPRNRYIAAELERAGLATLLFDLLTPDEERIDARTRAYRFDIEGLAQRLLLVTGWVKDDSEAGALELGYFGASTGAAAALIAAARRPDDVAAVVSRGGRPDLAGPWLPRVRAPTLLIVGGLDAPVIVMNEEALARLISAREKALEVVPDATHLFEEPGTLEVVADLAARWFVRHIGDGVAEAP
jgi:pimeloyl-ACP methyl ester carboxylesterase